MTKRARLSLLFAAGAAFAGAVSLAQAQVPIPPVPPTPPKPPFASPQDVIAARRAAMKTEGGLMQAMGKALQAGEDPAGFAPDAQWIADWAKQMPAMFPPGSDTGDTKALPAIWSEKSTFDQRAADTAAAAAKLAQLAADKDTAGFAAQLKVLGGTCGACHRPFKST